jgi:D-glycero-D-manno-heptose 1,7-bisphosphate phosphatase
VERVHVRLNELLRPYLAHVDAFFYCPHAPESACACRKPGTRLFEDAARTLGIDFGSSAIVGDRMLDVEAGRRLGLLTALVTPPGHDGELAAESAQFQGPPDIVARTFLGGVLRVLARG